MSTVDVREGYQRAAAITPHDTNPMPFAPIKAVYVGGAGNVAVRTMAGQVVTFTAPPVGSILPVEIERVMGTNTTATLLVALG